MEGAVKAMDIAKDYGLIVIPGVEVTTGEGHLLAYGVTEEIPMKMGIRETVDYVHDLGGIVAPAHPFSPLGVFFMDKNKDLLEEDFFDAIEVTSIIKGGICKNAMEFSEEKKLPKIGGSDSKISGSVGDFHTEINTKSKSLASVLNAIKSGDTRPVIIRENKPFNYGLRIIYTNYLSGKKSPSF